MLRIVAGEWRGRRLVTPDDNRVRPTADRIKEAWMSILGDEIVGARVLDLFAGSGALGLEMLSRGAAEAHFVELSPRSLAAIAKNIGTVNAGDRAVVHRADAIRFVDSLAPRAFDIAVADPPYDLGLASALVTKWMARPFASLLAVEHRRSEKLPGDGDARRYGDTVITFYRAPD